jgi:hypothetical protein
VASASSEASARVTTLSAALRALLSRLEATASVSNDTAHALGAASSAVPAPAPSLVAPAEEKVGWLECKSHVLKRVKTRHCWLLASGKVHVTNKPLATAHTMWLEPATIECTLLAPPAQTRAMRVGLPGGGHEELNAQSTLLTLQVR